MGNETLLLKRIQMGDEEALLELHRQYVDLVYSVVYRVLGNQLDAEEVTQDAFMSLWHKAALYSPQKGSFIIWFLVLAKHQAIDYWRRHNKNVVPQLSMDETPQLWENIHLKDDSELRRVLMMALADLPLQQKEVLQYAYFYGMSHREISEHTGQPLGTVKTHIREGMKKLRLAWLSHDE